MSRILINSDENESGLNITGPLNVINVLLADNFMSKHSLPSLILLFETEQEVQVYLCRWPDILPKDILPNGHFARRRTLCRTNILSNGQFDERTFRRNDILPKRQLAENREILGAVIRTACDWLLNKTSQSYVQFINLMTETLIVK